MNTNVGNNDRINDIEYEKEVDEFDEDLEWDSEEERVCIEEERKIREELELERAELLSELEIFRGSSLQIDCDGNEANTNIGGIEMSFSSPDGLRLKEVTTVEIETQLKLSNSESFFRKENKKNDEKDIIKQNIKANKIFFNSTFFEIVRVVFRLVLSFVIYACFGCIYIPLMPVSYRRLSAVNSWTQEKIKGIKYVQVPKIASQKIIASLENLIGKLPILTFFFFFYKFFYI